VISRLLVIAVFSAAALAQQLETGVVHEKVLCQQDASQSYALYLPKAYTPSHKWPVIYVFDPFARGNVPLEFMKDAAERAGLIVAASNNSRNGPIKDSIDAAQAMWADTQRRFAIDERQRYATGLSGGARVATTIAQLCGNCMAGVVAQGAGFHDTWPPSKKSQFVVYGTAGNLDFNYIEMVELDKKLEDLEIPHRLRVFAGGHQYAPAEIWDEVFGWLKLQAVQRGIVPRDQALIDRLRNADIARAAALESQGDLAQLLREHRALVSDFKGLADVTQFEKKLAEMEDRKDVKQALKDEREAIARQRRSFQEALAAFQIARDTPDQGPTALAAVRSQAARLRGEIRKSKDENSPQVIPLRRTLSQILSQAIEMGQQAIRDKEYALAITYLDIAIEYARAAPLAYFEKARALALTGRNKDVLPALHKAVETGLGDPTLITNAAEFASLKENPEFQQIVELAKQKR
jgi:dienelactone hydrolase